MAHKHTPNYRQTNQKKKELKKKRLCERDNFGLLIGKENCVACFMCVCVCVQSTFEAFIVEYALCTYTKFKFGVIIYTVGYVPSAAALCTYTWKNAFYARYFIASARERASVRFAHTAIIAAVFFYFARAMREFKETRICCMCVFLLLKKKEEKTTNKKNQKKKLSLTRQTRWKTRQFVLYVVFFSGCCYHRRGIYVYMCTC